MTSTVGTCRRRSARPGRSGAFTLIELILVMALLIIAVAGVAPRLSAFFSGRTLDSEAQRFLALTRYGQSQAVSEGVTMILWMDPGTGAYGLRRQEGFVSSNTISLVPNVNQLVSAKDTVVSFQLSDKLRFKLDQGTAGSKPANQIQFAPDGSIDEESPQTVVIQRDNGERVSIVQANNQLNYVMEQNANGSKTTSR